MEKEIWKDIPLFKGFYQASNTGRIRSLKREVTTKAGHKMVFSGRIMKTYFDKLGYERVCLTKDCKKHTRLVHQLVAAAFLNHKRDGHNLVVDHIDNVKTNNNVSNLQIITQRANASKNQHGSTSKYVGVCWDKRRKRWEASIKIKDKKRHLGYFDDEIAASNAYQDALKKWLDRQTRKVKEKQQELGYRVK